MAHDALKLPAAIVGPADLARAKRDLDIYNEDQHQADLRAKKTGEAKTVLAGRVISELAALNQVELTDAAQRAELLAEIEKSLKSAPSITISFAVDPSAAFMARIVDWLRSSIHPQVLVRIGLRPNIAAGCILRTSSKIYDFSLRHKLDEQSPLLIKAVRASAGREDLPAYVKQAVEA